MSDKPWVPLPIYEIEEIKRELVLINKDIENNTLFVKFKRFLNISGKIQIAWSLDINGKIISEKTDFCDDS